MDQKTTIDKLRVLLPHWVEHNHHHGDEFRKWASQAREEGQGPVAELLEQAVASMAATDALLEQALTVIGGPVKEHHHHHGHDGHHHHHHD